MKFIYKIRLVRDRHGLLSPGMVRCPKCGGQFDPRVQARACHAGVRHFPIKRVSEWQPSPPASAEKPKRRTPFQFDFQLLWDETQPYPRAPR
jgi:hypothetical protein